VFPVKYEHHLHIKSEAIHVTGRGGPYMCVSLDVGALSTYKKAKLSP
jgi:hypothetical protein